MGGEFDRQTNKFGFSTVHNEFQARFQGGKDKVSTVNNQTETHFAETWRDILKQTRLRSETH